MSVTYFLVIMCNKIGVTTVKNPMKEYAARVIDKLLSDAISVYRNGWATTPTTLDDNEKN